MFASEWFKCSIGTAHLIEHCLKGMVLYSVYKASFRTQKGTLRHYIGYSGWVDVRRGFHESDPGAWMKPMAGGVIDFCILESGIPSLGMARACEALHAARAIKKDRWCSRGGPWAKEELHKGWEKAVDEVARCRSLAQLSCLAEQDRRSALYRHLKGLTFVAAGAEDDEEDTWRGAVEVKRRVGNSGCPGNVSRRSQRKRGILKRPSAWHERVHRGTDPKAARRRETANRQRN